LSQKECFDLIKGARFLVWPSEGYNETFGLVAIEAFACGIPVIAAGMAAMKEIVEDRWSGLHFTPGDANDLASKATWAWSHPKEMEAMGRAARSDYQAKYTAEINYRLLMEIYCHARGATARKAA
jgi:glycosyltransferase involved in cell wall biosynthesis